jgi:hypothetical protein
MPDAAEAGTPRFPGDSMTAMSQLFRVPAPAVSPVNVRPVGPGDAQALLRLAQWQPPVSGDIAATCTDLLEFNEALFDAPVRAWAWLAFVGDEAIGYAVATVGFSLRARGYCLHLDCLHTREEWARDAEPALFEQVREMAHRLGCVQLHWHGAPDGSPRFDAFDVRSDGLRHVLSLT